MGLRAGLWKFHTWHVTNAYFGNRQNGASDFRIFRSHNKRIFLNYVYVANQFPI